MINDEKLGGDLKQPKLISGGKIKIDQVRINPPPDLNMYIQILQGRLEEDWNLQGSRSTQQDGSVHSLTYRVTSLQACPRMESWLFSK